MMEENFHEPVYGRYQEEKPHQSHPWKARFIVGFIIVVFSFLGLIVSSLWEARSWDYWRICIGTFALLSLWLGFYTRKKNQSFSFIKLWQELFLWVPLVLAGAIFSLFVYVGTMNNFQASLALLTSLSMILLIGGMYIEPSFIFTGLALALFAAGAAYLKSYLYTILLPVALLTILCLFFFAYYKKKN